MSDYWTEIDISRDRMVSMLTDNLEQTPYVLANVAEDLAPGTHGFDDFCDQLDTLNADQKKHLRVFCSRLANHLEEGGE
ncbi:MAG: hypothetical protein CML69_00900 [Rhodobacteraceae bacterium]|nr:hypothetical protein [Paracoccaceae bacterium]